MNTRKLLVVAGALLGVVLIFQVLSLDDGEAAFVEQTERERAQLLKAWKDPGNSKSPVPQAARATFELPHYAVSRAWRVEAELSEDTDVPKLPDVAGWLSFRLQGQTCRLLAFWERPTGPDALFIPFYDATTGKTTYGGGRYLNARLRKDGTVTLDFNQCFNPYCVFDPQRYGSCPLPPAENRLPFEVTAGQKLWQPARTQP